MDKMVETDEISAIKIQILEAKFRVNVAKIGDMWPYAILRFNGREYKTPSQTASRMETVWSNEYLYVENPTTDEIDIILMHKTPLFSDVEIGRVQLHTYEVFRGHMVEWWSIINSTREIAGTVLVRFEAELREVQHYDYPRSISQHASSSSNSRHEDPQEGLRRNRSGNLIRAPSRPESGSRRRVHTDESYDTFNSSESASLGISDINQLQSDLNEETNRIQRQEAKVNQINDRLKQERDLIKQERREFRQRKETLCQNEEMVIAERKKLEMEQEEFSKEKEKYAKKRQEIHLEQEKLRLQQLKIAAESKIIETETKKLQQQAKALEKQKLLLESRKQDSDNLEKTKLELAWEEIDKIRTTIHSKQKTLDEHIIRFNTENMSENSESINYCDTIS